MVNLSINLPKDFLKEETRCNYTISTEMKKVWAVELDLLYQLLSVCKKYEIPIYAAGGTLLGAIRHKGMIPWDDDIDMVIVRKDYERLCDVASKEFKYPYFFQTEYTDPGSLRGHAQLRNSETTGALPQELISKIPINQGIFLDIFPIDSFPDNEIDWQKQRQKEFNKRKLAFFISKLTTRYCEDDNDWKGVVRKILHVCLKTILEKLDLEKKNYQQYEKICSMYNDKLTKKMYDLSWTMNNDDIYAFSREVLDTSLMIPFEFMEIPVCGGFDEVLKLEFGDYSKFVKGGALHGNVYFDTNNSYREYLCGNLTLPKEYLLT